MVFTNITNQRQRGQKQKTTCNQYLNVCSTVERPEGLAVASIARDDPSTLPGDDPFPRARMHRDRNAR